MNSRKRNITIAAALALAFALVLGVGPVFAVHIGTLEIDGNVVNDSTDAGEDWEDVFTFPGCGFNTNSEASIGSCQPDPAPLSIFTGGGSKDEQDIPNWKWRNGSVPDKDDLTNGFAAVYSATVGTETHQILYFGADRFANNGDAQIGFWFFQNAVSLNTTNGTFNGTHAVGDLLILSNFTGGGANTNIQVLEVTAINANGSLTFTTLTSASGGTTFTCDDTAGDGTGPHKICVATNAAAVDSLDPNYDDKFGTAAGTYPPVVFFEGGLDLTALGLGGECFPAFLVETRSSASIDAVLKDFTLKELQSCVSSVSTAIRNSVGDDITGTTVPVNTVIHDEATVTGSQGLPLPTGTVTFDRFNNATCTGTAAATETVNLSTGTVSGNTVTVETADFTASTPGSLCYKATYSGDGLYPSAVSDIEPLTVSRFDSAVNTRILLAGTTTEVTNQAINLAGAASVAVQDEATVAGSVPTPTGTVTFTRFSNGNCTGTATTEDVTLDASGKALSATFALGPNTLSYTAIYGGDSNYNGSGVSKCEPVCALNFTTTQTQQ